MSKSNELLEIQQEEHRKLQQSSDYKPSEFLYNVPVKKEKAETGEETIDLNYRLVCKDCKKIPANIVENYKEGDYVCGDCGLVLPMRIIDSHSEWRNFANDGTGGGDDPSRVGASENPLLEGVVDQLSTQISGLDNRTGVSIALQRSQIKATGSVKGDRDLMQTFRDISILTDNVGTLELSYLRLT
jgi:transcription initiation factor TFIIB